MDITQPSGNMVVDVGGGTTDVAVLSLGGIVVNTSIKVAGDKFDESIIRYMRKKHNLLIGDRTAEELKIKVGTAYPRDEEITMDIRGRDLLSGLPKTLTVNSEEMRGAERDCLHHHRCHTQILKRHPRTCSDVVTRGSI